MANDGRTREELILASADPAVTKITVSNMANFFILLLPGVLYVVTAPAV
jgi:hypothetical protein